MKFASAEGMISVRERSYPLAGLDSAREYSNGNRTIELAGNKAAPEQWATYSRLYRENPWVFSAVAAISWALSRLPLKLYQTQPDGSKLEVVPPPPGAKGAPTLEQQLARVLQYPAPMTSRQEWVRKIAIDKLVYGNALVSVEEGSFATPIALHHTQWSKIYVNTGENVPILNYVYKGSKADKEFRPDEVLHFGRAGDVDQPLGLSPLQPLKYTLALHDAIARHLNHYFANAARPSGVMKVEPNIKDGHLQQLQKQLELMYTSPENAGRILVTSGEFKPIGTDPASAQIVELAKLSREEIAAAFQVPPPVLGILERAIQANVVELRSQFLRDVVGPHAAGIEGDLNAQLIQARPELASRGLFVAFDMSAALRPDLTELATIFEKTRHVLTPNEQREMMGFAPLRGSDLVDLYANTVWYPSGQVPLGLPQPQMKGALEEAKNFDPAHASEPDPIPAADAHQAPYR